MVSAIATGSASNAAPPTIGRPFRPCQHPMSAHIQLQTGSAGARESAPAVSLGAATRTPIGLTPQTRPQSNPPQTLPPGCQFPRPTPTGVRPCGNCLWCREVKLHRAGATAALEAVLHKKTVWATFTVDPERIAYIERRRVKERAGNSRQTTWQSYARVLWQEEFEKLRANLRVPAFRPYSWRAWLEFGKSGEHSHFHILVHGDDISTRQVRKAWTFGFEQTRLSRSRDPRQHARYAAKAAKYHSKDQKPSNFKGRTSFRSLRYGKPARLIERAKVHPDTWLTLVRDEWGFRPVKSGYPIVGPVNDRVFREWALDAIQHQLALGLPVYLQEIDDVPF